MTILGGITAIWYFSSISIEREDHALILSVLIAPFIIWIVIAIGIVAFIMLARSRARLDLAIAGLVLLGFSVWYYAGGIRARRK